MDFTMGPGATALRSELRELVREHVPPDFMGAFTDDPADLELAQRFCRVLAERGLLCMAWPEEFGGRGASAWEQTVVREEMWAHHEPRGAQYMGVNWVGPAIMRHGTAEQRRTHLPPIARGEVIWCQGFSEPDAGSDLASLRTTARPDNSKNASPVGGSAPATSGVAATATPTPVSSGADNSKRLCWRVYGQKIWTSYATMAQWCFLLARTSTGEKKQQGLTIFLVPMSAPGIEVRPIRAMLGPHHLNEVFFDGVRVTEADVLGPVGGGWQVVQEVLAFERVGIARYARCERLLLAAPRVLGDQWRALPAELRGRWARMLVHCRRARLLAYRVISLQSAGTVTPGDAAAYRIAVTRLDQESAEVLMEILGLAVLSGTGGTQDRWFRLEVEDHWRYSQASTVASGSIEMQRILLARTLLKPPVPSGQA
jgi:alkylation response protein AidB-like acyl-CoA dehydrogenase